ncbi:MAG: translation initiation factor IF-2 [Candidatus Moraniibacteriota bacterium]
MPKISLPPTITVKEFAKRLDKPVSDTIKILMDNGFLATINEEMDYDTAAIIALELGFEVEKEEPAKGSLDKESPFELSKLLKEEKKNISKNRLKKRPPIVTILGHVDHGKTTLLDTIRRTKVAEGESGGITQHITAYQVKAKGKTITFVDTPGHEAFQKMRARGAGIADIAIIIIAADDGVKPQTKEVLENIKDSKLPFIICLNKIDKPGANPEKVKGQLAELGVLVEGWGGEIPIVAISAKLNKNIDDLLETILLVSEIENFTAIYDKSALGLVLESHLDKRRGPIATVIVKSGTLKRGDLAVAGKASGNVRMIEDFLAKSITAATPSMPVTILGFDKLPQAGSVIKVTFKDKLYLKQKKATFREEETSKSSSPLKRIEQSLETEKYKKLNVVIKADTQGSLEAIKQILESLAVEDVVIKIIKSGVGQITESDILLTKVSNAILYGFRVNSSITAQGVQEKEKVKPRFFDVIYHLTADIQEEMKKIVTIQEIRVDHGTLKVLAIFRTGKKDMIIGGKVADGKLVKGDQLEVVRDEEIIAEGILAQLKKGKEDFNDCVSGEECGVTMDFSGPLVKIREGDKILSFEITKK